LVRCYEDLGSPAEDDQLRSGRIDLAGVELPEDADAYLCGPLPFMAAVHRSLLDRGVDGERICYEVFGPARELVAG
jgi:nitric oxide dioxygenase